MNAWDKISSAWRVGAKEAPGGYPSGASWLFSPSAGRIRHLLRKVGDGSHSAIVGATLNTLADSFIEPPLALWEPSKEDDTQIVQVRDHQALELLADPNPYMNGDMLWWYYIWASRIHGNAFFVKVRTQGTGRPIELWPLRPDLVKPKYPHDGSRFLDGWEYSPGQGTTTVLAPEDVVHLRIGPDSQDFRLGYAPLQNTLKEVLTDEEAAAYTASLLNNMAIPGVVLTPDPKAGGGPADPESIKDKFEERFSGDNRGRALVLGGPMKVQIVSFSPQALDLKALRRIPEERITAALRVPAILANLGAGMEMSSGRSEARAVVEMFTERTMAPEWKRVARQLTRQLLPDFDKANPRTGTLKPKRWFDFDLSDVRSLQEDRDNLWSRTDRAVRSGWITVAAGKLIVGLEPEEGDDVYLRPMSVDAVPVGVLPEPSPLE